MQKILFGAMAAAGMLALSACATLDEDECKVVDWNQLGQQDGARGANSSYYQSHQDACTKFGITVDVSAWQAGWSSGIRSYCTPQNAIQVGLGSGFYANSCPADLNVAFSTAYRHARAVRDARRQRDALNAEIDRDLRALREATPEEAENLRLAIDLKRDRLWDAERRLLQAERELDFYRLRERL